MTQILAKNVDHFTDLNIQTFLLNVPTTLSIDNPNNAWMDELEEKDKVLDRDLAYSQWLSLYNTIASEALVYLLPSLGEYQDQTYVANIGLVLPHLKQRVMVLSNFKSEPRQGEEKVAKPFLEMLGYKIVQPPNHFEGEAECKYLRDDIYIAGYGQRSDIESYGWMEQKLRMKIVKLRMVDEYLYHLDCSIFPLTEEQVMMGCDFFTEEEIAEIEKVAEIFEVSEDDCYGGITNSVRVGNQILCASDIVSKSKKDKYYQEEKDKVERLEKICGKVGMEPVLINLSEFTKSGALLSCLCCHLTYVDNKVLI